MFFVGILSATDEKSRIWIPRKSVVRIPGSWSADPDPDPWIRIHIKMSWIHNIGSSPTNSSGLCWILFFINKWSWLTSSNSTKTKFFFFFLNNFLDLLEGHLCYRCFQPPIQREHSFFKTFENIRYLFYLFLSFLSFFYLFFLEEGSNFAFRNRSKPYSQHWPCVINFSNLIPSVLFSWHND
jgi:hypothetical protein